jgi:hypothetical protein
VAQAASAAAPAAAPAAALDAAQAASAAALDAAPAAALDAAQDASAAALDAAQAAALDAAQAASAAAQAAASSSFVASPLANRSATLTARRLRWSVSKSHTLRPSASGVLRTHQQAKSRQRRGVPRFALSIIHSIQLVFLQLAQTSAIVWYCLAHSRPSQHALCCVQKSVTSLIFGGPFYFSHSLGE